MVRTYAVHPLGGVVLMSYPLVAFSAQSSLCFCLVSTPEQCISCPTVISCDWAVLPVDLMHEVVFSTRRDFPDGLGAFGRECRLPKSNRYFRDCGSSCSVNQVDLVVRQSCSCYVAFPSYNSIPIGKAMERHYSTSACFSPWLGPGGFEPARRRKIVAF